jgi:hypothetical protein
MKKVVITLFTLLFFPFFLISCAPSACECANILSDRTAEGDILMKKALNGNGTFEPRNEYWASKARKCMEAYTDMKEWEIKAYQDAGRMISDGAIINAEKECGPETNFNNEQINVACECWNQSYSKSGLAFDDMNSSQQILRTKCFELFKDAKNMEAACNQTPKNSSTETEADTKITVIKLPPAKKNPKNLSLVTNNNNTEIDYADIVKEHLRRTLNAQKISYDEVEKIYEEDESGYLKFEDGSVYSFKNVKVLNGDTNKDGKDEHIVILEEFGGNTGWTAHFIIYNKGGGKFEIKKNTGNVINPPENDDGCYFEIEEIKNNFLYGTLRVCKKRGQTKYDDIWEETKAKCIIKENKLKLVK